MGTPLIVYVKTCIFPTPPAPPQIIEDSLALHTIARRLRGRRFDNGALRLDNTKLTFSMDTGGNPVACAPYVQQEANQLVEEYMLLANMQVAKFISTAFPDHALLRCELWMLVTSMLAAAVCSLEYSCACAGTVRTASS